MSTSLDIVGHAWREALTQAARVDDLFDDDVDRAERLLRRLRTAVAVPESHLIGGGRWGEAHRWAHRKRDTLELFVEAQRWAP